MWLHLWAAINITATIIGAGLMYKAATGHTESPEELMTYFICGMSIISLVAVSNFIKQLWFGLS